MAKFNIGDRVQATRQIGKAIRQGLTGTIMDNSGYPDVKWDDRKIGLLPVDEDDLRLYETDSVSYEVY